MSMKYRQTAENKEVRELLSYPGLQWEYQRQQLLLSSFSKIFLLHVITINADPLTKKIMINTTPKHLPTCTKIMTACDDFPQSSSFSFVLQDILVEATKSEIAAALEISDNNASFFLERVDHLERS